jgi:aminocarboxymuconate-semialdehyde decarboxylase
MEVLGLNGVTLVSSYTHITIDSEWMMPVYEKIVEYDVPIVVHPTLRRPLWGGEKYDLSTTVSREYDLAKCVVEVLYGVLPKYPDLKFLMPHFGGGMQVLKYRLLSSHQPEGWDLPEGARGHGLTPRELKERGLWEDFHRQFDKIYFDSAGFGGSMVTMRAAVDGVRRDRITFGTDYPYEFRDPRDVREYIADIKSLNISEGDKRSILSQNVLDLFKIR